MKSRKKSIAIVILLLLHTLLVGCFTSASSHIEELDELQSQFTELEETHAATIEATHVEKTELEESISLLEEEINTLANENEKFVEDNEGLQFEVDKLHQMLEEIEQERIAQLTEETGLVNIKDIDDTIIVDLPYATPDNFVEKQVYPVEVCLLQLETAKKLKSANDLAKQDGYRIKIWDGYRPHDVQFIFWELTPDRDYVGDPNKGSNHNRGAAVDVTLVDEEGNELEMPTGFDDLSEKAWLNYQGNSAEAQKNMEYLVDIMRQSGFKTINIEWWHFNDSNASAYPVLNVPLEEFVPLIELNE